MKSNKKKYEFYFLAVVSNDYDCLNQMNALALDKYNQIERKLERLNETVRTMNESNGNNKTIFDGYVRKNICCLARKFSSIFGQLNEIEDAMTNLESTVMKLDAYSRSLESQLKKYEKVVIANRTLSPTQN